MPVFALVCGVFDGSICSDVFDGNICSGVFDASIYPGVWSVWCQYLLLCLVCLMPVFALMSGVFDASICLMAVYNPVSYLTVLSGVFDASICSGVWCV